MIHFSINRPAPIFIFILMLTVLGVVSYQTIPRESNPDIQIPILIVAVPFPGASPEDVESLITHKTEVEFQGLEGVDKMTSVSAEGVSTITLEFDPDYDLEEARTKVREAVDRIEPELPDDAEDAIIQEINLSEQPLLIINLASDLGLSQLKEIAEDLQDEIESIPGILEVRRAGGLDREIRVHVNPDKLLHHQVALNQIGRAIREENVNLPGGDLELGPHKYLIRVPGEFEAPQDVENTLLSSPEKVPVLVKDIATVVYGFKEKSSLSRMDGVESISLSVVKRSGENLLQIREKIFELIEQDKARYQGQVLYSVIADQGKWVVRFVRDLENNIITGFLLVFLVLLVVMGVRNSLFVAAAIPLSFLMTMVVLDIMGFTLNTMILFSLILALGMLVDNAVVVVENIYRHVQAGKPRIEAAKIGISEVALPITTSTLTTLAAFAPLLFMPGIVGEFMSFLPKTLIVALSCSLVVGLFINPVLCSTLMKVPQHTKKDADELSEIPDSAVFRAYAAILHFCLRFRVLTSIAVFALFFIIMNIYASTTLKKEGVEFFPQGEPNQATINVTAPMGTRLGVSNEYVKQVETYVSEDADSLVAMVANVGMRQGSGAQDAGSTTPHLSHVVLEFPDWENWVKRPSELLNEIREKLKALVGVEVLVSKQQGGPPTGPPINIEIEGDDLNVMAQISSDIQQKIRNIEGLVDLRDNFDQDRSEIRVLIDRAKAGRLGLRAQDIALTVRTAFNGNEVSKYRDGQEEYDIIVKLDDPFRENIQNLESLYIQTPQGAFVPISEVAHIETGPAYGSIRHVNQERVITLSANAEGIPGPVLLQKVQAVIAEMDIPAGNKIRFTGENQDQQESQIFLFQSFFTAVFLIFLILTAQFNSVMLPLVILSSVILSLMGVILGLMIHSNPFSVIMTGIGTVSLAGIVVNNAIVLIDFINQLREKGLEKTEAIVSAGMIRLRPVILTAITTVLGLIPVAMGMDINFFRWPIVILGAESGTFWKPMAFAVIYGLAFATLLTLVVVPIMYSIFDSIRVRLLDTWKRFV